MSNIIEKTLKYMRGGNIVMKTTKKFVLNLLCKKVIKISCISVI